MRPRIVLITDPRYEDDALAAKLDAALAVAPPGFVAVQLRDKARPTGKLLPLARRLRATTREHGALFLVNDRIDLALAAEADGVHLGRLSVSVRDARELVGPDAFVSVAAHTHEEVRQALADGASAALLSPIFASPGKGEPLGVDALRIARESAPTMGVYALGGIDATNARACLDAGASGVALIRAFFDDADPAAAMRRLLDAVG